ncbi:sensor histidine kinase [Demequina sp.]|uniref:sensor histidine kinase n=1 Tax=Demequina sp. TaxID=2050685 RepID=UPI003D0CC749
MSLRDRVLVAFAVIATVAIAIAVVVVASTHSYLINQLDQRLTQFAGGPPSESWMNSRPTNQTGTDDQGDGFPGGDRPSDVFRGFITADGTLKIVIEPNVGGNTGEPDVAVSQLPAEGSATFSVPSTEGGAGYRVYVRTYDEGWDVTALPLDDVQSTTQRLILIEAIGILTMLLGLGLVAAWVIRLGVNPMRRMVDASGRIAEGDLSVRLEGAGHGSESAELAASLNTMIETLTTSLRERERSEARLREFVADASHELRTPLTTVLGYAELYRRGALTRKADVADAWTRTEAEASRMKRLVSDMLELAKYDAEPALGAVDVELRSLCDEIAGDALAAHAGASVTVAGEAVSVTGDPDKLRQAVINVVNNALLHGGGSVTISVASAEGHARVAVSDDGPGMPPELAARATERFVRGDESRSRAHGGAGLGLAITAAIVDAHRGVIAVDSTPGEGTTVTLVLPRP